MKDKEGTLSMDKLLTLTFIQNYTDFDDIASFVRESGLTEIDTHNISKEDFEEFKEERLDDFVRENSVFETWDEMVMKASEIYFSKQFDGFGEEL